ncbi:MAG TPA: VWA domain-containing protein [Niabella sp.]|nr:VWA domain-containing protein [Niabella sp.]HRB27488.1 VWA domain-containing protein [Niabella sp.]HRB63756.1 VWA domain-containing protein [Niabella sp.]HRB73525.1 VWA domain-containing protein [Niabella sp.]
MSFQFQYPYLASLLAIIILLLLLFLSVKKWKRAVIKKIGQPVLVKGLLQRYSTRKFNTKFLLICLAFAMGVLAVMNLRKTGGSDGIQRNGIDLIFALDVSKSMLASDIAPNRLERAKQFISKMMDAMPGSRIGLILFAGKAYLQMPLSSDHSAAQMFVQEASPDAVPAGGTVIGDALQESLNAFGERDAKYRAVVLISDGEDHDEKAISLSQELARRGLMVNTVGIGSAAGSYIPDDSTGSGRKTDPETGVEILSKLNETELKQIAANTKGVYVHLTNTDMAVKEVKKSLSQIATRVSGDESLMSFSYYFWVFIALMILLLVGEIFVSEGKKETKNQIG